MRNGDIALICLTLPGLHRIPNSGNPMRKLALMFISGCLLVPAISRADAGEEVGPELGAVLSWRLGPETVEETCRTLDPDGAEARKKALSAWLDKNAALIKEVDARVAEVAPLAYATPPGVDLVEELHGQVKQILLEPMFLKKSPEERAAVCKKEADPVSSRWNSDGKPQVPQALAALNDWKVRQTAK